MSGSRKDWEGNTLDSIILKAISQVEKGEKVNPDYLKLVATELGVSGGAVPGRLFLNDQVKPPGGGKYQDMTNPASDYVNYVYPDLVYNCQFRQPPEKGVKSPSLPILPLREYIESNEKWQSFWNERFAANKDDPNMSAAYSNVLKGLIYSIACSSTKEGNVLDYSKFGQVGDFGRTKMTDKVARMLANYNLPPDEKLEPGWLQPASSQLDKAAIEETESKEALMEQLRCLRNEFEDKNVKKGIKTLDQGNKQATISGELKKVDKWIGGDQTQMTVREIKAQRDGLIKLRKSIDRKTLIKELIDGAKFLRPISDERELALTLIKDTKHREMLTKWVAAIDDPAKVSSMDFVELCKDVKVMRALMVDGPLMTKAMKLNRKAAELDKPKNSSAVMAKALAGGSATDARLALEAAAKQAPAIPDDPGDAKERKAIIAAGPPSVSTSSVGDWQPATPGNNDEGDPQPPKVTIGGGRGGAK